MMFLEPTSILVFIVIALLSYYVMDCYRKSTNIPGPLRLPYVGNIFTIQRHTKGNMSLMMPYLKRHYGRISRIFFGDQMLIFLSSKELIQEAFVKQKENFSMRPSWLLRSNAGSRTKGLVWSNGDTSKQQRRLVLQYFREFGLGKRSLENQILEEIDVLCQVLDKHTDKSINAEPIVGKAILNLIHSMVFGHRLEYDDEKMISLQKDMNTIFKLPGILHPSNFFVVLRFLGANSMKIKMEAFKRLHEYVLEEARIHNESFDKSNIRDFIDVYLQTEVEPEGKFLTKENLINMILDIFAAGSDTTAATILWLFQVMIKYPEVQDKCFEEIANNVGTSRPVLLSDKTNLKYVESTILETQRMSNVAFGSLPHTTLTDTSVSGYLIPKGSAVIASLHDVHYDDSEWENPKMFDPSRFLDNDNNVKKFGSFMPFSIGPRACPGENLAKTEFFLIFANVIQKFKLTRANNDPLTFEGVTGVTTLPKSFELRFNLRS